MSQTNKNTRWNSPVLLSHNYRHCLWGGDRLAGSYTTGVSDHDEPLAEIWACSTYPGNESVIVNGKFSGRLLTELVEEHPEVLGRKHSDKRFPVLVKLIDAKEPLSLQVHPDDEYARENEDSELGKTELWHVLEADDAASVTHGFLHDTDRDELQSWIDNGELEHHVRLIPVKQGDTILIDSGTIHGINAGSVIAEVQENSDLTYRIWDYLRKDASGKERELHIDKAMDVLNFRRGRDIRTPIRQIRFIPGSSDELLGRCRYFELHRMMINKVSYRSSEESFEILLCIEGSAEMSWGEENVELKKGSCVFVPAGSCETTIEGKAALLRIVC